MPAQEILSLTALIGKSVFNFVACITLYARRIVVWDIAACKELQRTSTPKYTLGGLGHFPHPHCPNYMLMCRKDSSELSLVDTSQSSSSKEDLVEVLDLNTAMSPSKKDCKIYNFVVHPLLPYYVVCATSKGTCVARVGWYP